MDDKELWIVTAKLKALEGCSVDFDGSEFYFVECLLPASNESEATAPIEHAMCDERFELISIEHCSQYVASDWENEVQYGDIQEAANKAKESNELEFALFISSQVRDGAEEDEDDDGIEWS